MQARTIIVAGALAVLLAAGAAQAITIDTVTVGNPGNAGEVQSQGTFGSVSYTYNIGKYEVTAGQYTAFLNAVGGVDTYALYNTDMSRTDYGSGIARSGGGTVANPYTYEVATAFTNRPVNYVSWFDTLRFANWMTNGQGTGSTESGGYTITGGGANAGTVTIPDAAQRAAWSAGTKSYFLLTSEDEWYKAAYYKGGSTTAGYWDYPTGSDTGPGRDMTDASGNNANYCTAPYAYPIDNGKYTTVVGEFQDSNSPYGTFDQGGNVWEWNEAAVTGWSRGVRGGSFGNYDIALLASYRGSDSYPTTEYADIGFRVSEFPEPIPEPLTLLSAFLGTAALGGYIRGRGRKARAEIV